jgi:ubiquinone/menaquinone biosynthesis C-methylase UbiE
VSDRTERTTAEWRQLAQIDPLYVIHTLLELRQVSDAEIPLPDGSVDAVFTCHVLQHLEGLDVVSAYLREVRRVLRSAARSWSSSASTAR